MTSSAHSVSWTGAASVQVEMTPVGVLPSTCYRNQVRISDILSHLVNK